MRIGSDHDVVASMIARHVQMHRDVAAVAARRASSSEPTAMDDAAGVAIRTRMKASAASAAAAYRNAQDGMSLMQVADGALAEMTGYLARIRVVSLQAANGTFDASQRSGLQVGIDGMLNGFDAVARSLDRGARVLQIGADAGDTMTTPELGGKPRKWGVSVLDADSARSALDVLDDALEELYAQRAEVGAAQNRLTRELSHLGVAEILQAGAVARFDPTAEALTGLQAENWARRGGEMLAQVERATRRAVEMLLGAAPEPSVPPTEDGDGSGEAEPAVAMAAETHRLGGRFRVSVPTAPGRTGGEIQTAPVAEFASDRTTSPASSASEDSRDADRRSIPQTRASQNGTGTETTSL